MTDALDDGRLYGAEGGESLESLQDIPDQIIDPWCDLCFDETSQKIEAGGFCTDCNSFLCQPCIKAHAKIPALRNHVIRRGARMPHTQSEKPIKYPDCQIHVGDVNDYFCLDHRIMMCSQCIQETHTLCNIKTISDVCKTLGSADVSIFREAVSSIHNNIVSSNSALETNINDMKNKRNQMIKQAQDFRDKIIAQAKDRYSETISKINDVSSQNIAYLAEQVLLLSDINHRVDKTISDIDKKINANLEPNLFIRIQEIAGNVGRCKIELEDISKQLKKVDLSFSVDKEMSAFLSRDCLLGEVKEVMEQQDILQPIPEICFPQSLTQRTSVSRKQDISQISAKKSGTLHISLGEDQFVCDVRGIDMTSNGSILLADKRNKKIKAFSPEKKIRSCLSLSAKPSDVKVVNKKTAVVSASDRKLYMLDISDLDSLSIQRTIDIGYPLGGIMPQGSNLVVVRLGKQPSVNMIDMEGKAVWSTSADHNGQTLFDKPCRVGSTLINDKPTIIVTDWRKNTLTLLDASNGNFLKTLNVKGKAPHGLTLDNDGNVYFFYDDTTEICVWSADLQHCRILLSAKELQANQRAVFYNVASDTLYVSYRNKDTLDCFQLRYK